MENWIFEKKKKKGKRGKGGKKNFGREDFIGARSRLPKKCKKEGKAIGTFEFSFPDISPLSMRENQARKEPWPLLSETLFFFQTVLRKTCFANCKREGGKFFDSSLSVARYTYPPASSPRKRGNGECIKKQATFYILLLRPHVCVGAFVFSLS